MVRYIGVDNMVRLVGALGIEEVLRRLADFVEEDFHNWARFEKTPRLASHSALGAIELMPTADGRRYGFKYVNGHPGNARTGLQTVAAFGVLSSVETGYPLLLSEMTIATALRTAATSAVAARHLARPDARTMAIIGLGAQSEFQAVAFRTLLGIKHLRVFDIDPAATAKFKVNLASWDVDIVEAANPGEATLGADIVTTLTADKTNATILSDNMIGAGQHLNAVGGDCPGKTELQPAILRRAAVFVEHTEQTRIEGEIQQMDPNFPVTELWRVISGEVSGRTSAQQITLFDSVGFAIEDFSTLRFLWDAIEGTDFYSELDLVVEPADPKNLFQLVTRPARPTTSGTTLSVHA